MRAQLNPRLCAKIGTLTTEFARSYAVMPEAGGAAITITATAEPGGFLIEVTPATTSGRMTPRTPDGLTKWGITNRTVIAVALDFNRDGRVDAADLRDMTRDQSRGVYRRKYWDKVRAGEIPGPAALLGF